MVYSESLSDPFRVSEWSIRSLGMIHSEPLNGIFQAFKWSIPLRFCFRIDDEKWRNFFLIRGFEFFQALQSLNFSEKWSRIIPESRFKKKNSKSDEICWNPEYFRRSRNLHKIWNLHKSLNLYGIWTEISNRWRKFVQNLSEFFGIWMEMKKWDWEFSRNETASTLGIKTETTGPGIECDTVRRY